MRLASVHLLRGPLTERARSDSQGAPLWPEWGRRQSRRGSEEVLLLSGVSTLRGEESPPRQTHFRVLADTGLFAEKLEIAEPSIPSTRHQGRCVLRDSLASGETDTVLLRLPQGKSQGDIALSPRASPRAHCATAWSTAWTTNPASQHRLMGELQLAHDAGGLEGRRRPSHGSNASTRTT